MPTLSPKYLRQLLQAQEVPCVSIYLPTHRTYPENEQDPIRYKNLVKQVEDSLARSYTPRETEELRQKLHQLATNALFWRHTLDGTVVLASPQRFDVFTLPRTMPERAVVADSFHVKPLLRYVQSADRFRVLALSRERAALYEGNRYKLDPLTGNGFPVTLTEVLGTELTEPHRDRHSSNAGHHAIAHGSGSRKDELDLDTQRFFRAVADRLPSNGVPIVLAALAEHQSPFRAACHRNHDVLPEGVIGDPFHLSPEELLTRAWKVVEPLYLQRLQKLCEDFGTAYSRGAGAADLADAAHAAVAARIGVLLVDADKVVPGVIDPVSGDLRPAELADPKVDDALDDLAEMVLRTGGDVVVVPAERMPTQTGLAAIFRY
ncbi:MAG: hypothetical protein NZ703_06350 [Gemmataceae bacterium]|nr:hypothetical protein [Gemmataceae bacterium]MCS7270688.1 hypothetical protein [Gemmataceae bacterium]MDW8244671.1 hypothetical protein [Thermogemmata sp.]